MDRFKPLKDGGQNAQILWHLCAGTELTPLEAQELIVPPCLRLAARVHELRKRGHDIKSKEVETSGGARIAKYWMDA